MASPVLARLAAAVLASGKSRKTVGWIIALILSPLILLTAFLCCFGTAAVEHNDFAVSASFYGPARKIRTHKAPLSAAAPSYWLTVHQTTRQRLAWPML